MKRIVKIVSQWLGIFSLLSILLSPQLVAAADVFQGCQGVPNASLCQSTNSDNQTTQSNSIYGPNGILTKITKILSYVVGIVSVIMIIIGGIRYALSSGDSANINGAKSTILHALIGLIVALLAQAIVVFILNKLYP